MSKNFLFKLTIFTVCMASSIAVFADVKIKTRQTMQGQTYENTTYIKGKRQRDERNMGGMQTVSIMQCDLRRDVQMMPAGKTYMVTPFGDGAPVNQTVSQTRTTTKLETGGTVTITTTIKDTGERKKMFGYTARHLIITTETEPSPDACQKEKTKMQMDGWYIDAAWELQCERGNYGGYTPNAQAGGCQDKYNFKQIGAGKRGYPIWEKMTMFDASGKETVSWISEVIELSQAALDASLFEIPADYREVKDSTQLYASMAPSSYGDAPTTNGANRSNPSNSAMNQTVANKANAPSNVSTTVGAKKPGTVRIGLASVKTGAVGEGINATELAGAIQNTLGEFLKGSKIELVALEAKLASAIDKEAAQKECDYILHVTVAHKKGGGGFGMFSKIAPALGNVVPLAGMGSQAGAVAGQVASTAIYTAANASGNIKAKDELTLDVQMKSASGAQALTKQFKAKAKAAGEDIITPIVEQAATAILEAAASGK
jgi:hypothetical protein